MHEENDKTRKSCAQKLGSDGEKAAAGYLRKKGYKPLLWNYREQTGARRGEIDLIAYSVSENLMLFVEVKTRTGDPRVRPAAAVTRKKQRVLVRTAMDYLRGRGYPKVSIRFDIMEIWAQTDTSITRIFSAYRFHFNHIEGAFCMPSGMIYG